MVLWLSAVTEWSIKFTFCIGCSLGTHVPPNTLWSSSPFSLAWRPKVVSSLEVLTGDRVARARERESTTTCMSESRRGRARGQLRGRREYVTANRVNGISRRPGLRRATDTISPDGRQKRVYYQSSFKRQTGESFRRNAKMSLSRRQLASSGEGSGMGSVFASLRFPY